MQTVKFIFTISPISAEKIKQACSTKKVQQTSLAEAVSYISPNGEHEVRPGNGARRDGLWTFAIKERLQNILVSQEDCRQR